MAHPQSRGGSISVMCCVSHRVRFWESAERTSRQGDVDGVAIITLVSF